MTFKEQTKGVPLAWVRQGWRRQPSSDADNAWRREGAAHQWNFAHTWSADGFTILLAQPVVMVDGCCVYAHVAWGGGLAPTPEMVRIWPLWWYLPAMGNYLRKVEVFESSEGLRFQCSEIPAKPITQARGVWRGPVLPPVEVA